MGEVRTIAVMGATGRQGRGVIEALQNISTKSIEKQIQYAIRPMTRSLTSKLAREFELDFPHLSLVQWRQDDTDSITECFDGYYGAFIDTGMFHVPEASMLELTRGEIALGKRCLEAANTASLSHIIYPTFPSIFNSSNGSINILRFETKHQISLEIHASSIPSTVLCPGPFYTDLYEPQYASWDGTTVIFSTTAAPETSVGFADPSHDIGLFTRAALDKGAQYMAGEEIPVCGPPLTYAELAARFTAVTGIQAAYRT
ncbi:NmrA-like family domain-containing protein, partial [Lachnellula hyalina]